MRSKSPIVVRKGEWALRGRGWVWSCKEHVRAKGYHAYYRRIDFVLERQGKPPRIHPRIRAMAGALEHYHKYHLPEHACCQVGDPVKKYMPRPK